MVRVKNYLCKAKHQRRNTCFFSGGKPVQACQESKSQDLTVSRATHQSNLSVIWEKKTGVKQERKTSHNQSRKSSISPHLVSCDSISTEKPAVWWTWRLSLICSTFPSKTLIRQDTCWITSVGIALLRRG